MNFLDTKMQRNYEISDEAEQIGKNILEQIKFDPELAFIIGQYLVYYANSEVEEALKYTPGDFL